MGQTTSKPDAKQRPRVGKVIPIPKVYEGDCSVDSVAVWVAARLDKLGGNDEIHHLIDDFSAFPRAFDIDGVRDALGGDIYDVGQGVKASKLVGVNIDLKKGYNINTSISHEGILAIYSSTPRASVQFTDLVGGQQNEINVELWTVVGFYDDSAIMLTLDKKLRLTRVKELFHIKDVSALEVVGKEYVNCCADVSLLNDRRTLLYRSTSFIPHLYNVDSRESQRLDFKKEILSFASLTGIDVDVMGVFQENMLRGSVFTLNNDFSTTDISKYSHESALMLVIPSCKDPNDLSKSMKIHEDGMFFTDSNVGTKFTTPVTYQYRHSVVRVYQHVFLMFDSESERWGFVKIYVQ